FCATMPVSSTSKGRFAATWCGRLERVYRTRSDNRTRPPDRMSMPMVGLREPLGVKQAGMRITDTNPIRHARYDPSIPLLDAEFRRNRSYCQRGRVHILIVSGRVRIRKGSRKRWNNELR